MSDTIKVTVEATAATVVLPTPPAIVANALAAHGYTVRHATNGLYSPGVYSEVIETARRNADRHPEQVRPGASKFAECVVVYEEESRLESGDVDTSTRTFR